MEIIIKKYYKLSDNYSKYHKPQQCENVYFLFLFLKFYLFMRDRGRDISRGRNRLPAGPDAELDPRTLGSQTEPKTDAQPLSHPGALKCVIGRAREREMWETV